MDKESQPAKSESQKVRDGEALTPKQAEQLKEAKVYLGMVKGGQLFMSYVLNDLNKTVGRELDRAKNRRMKKEVKQGVISEELVEYYGHKVKGILKWIKEKEKLSIAKKTSVNVSPKKDIEGNK